MHTLGVTEEKKYSKSDIALAQLVGAIDMFVSEKFLLCISLAGSAEEIFAGLLRAQSKRPVIEQSYDQIESLREATALNIAGGKSKREIIKEWNHVKNRTKHHDKDEDDFITFNACDEAYWLIKRALSNARLLNITVLNEHEFDNWVIVKTCL